MVTHARILFLFIYIGGLIALLMWMSPTKIQMLGYELRMFHLKDLSSYVTTNQKALEILSTKMEALNDLNSLSEKQDFSDVQADTSSYQNKIEYPENAEDALDGFFEALYTLKERKYLIRILHYGDSQLEGDRITEHLRAQLQNRFGGCGVGWIPIVELDNIRSTLWQKASSQWKKYAVYSDSRKTAPHRSYGLLGSYFTFTEKSDSDFSVANLKIAPTKNSYKQASQVQTIKCHYSTHETDSLRLILKWNDSLLTDEYLPPNTEYGVYSLEISNQEPFENIFIEFQGKGSPEIFGVSLDCKEGIAIDNIAMRGSSGTDFIHISQTLLSKMLLQNNVKLIIWQFGINVVPYLTKDFDYYEKSISAQLKHIKNADPNISILVVGVSDMAKKENGEIISYPNLTAVRDAQKRAAFANKCAFWDLYEAMGGRNSIIQWAKHKPAYANRDFAHFTREGARFTGELLYKELMKEYGKFLKKRRIELHSKAHSNRL
ncbi:MAG: hypothetical protein NZM38_04885 [Cytophagales bacterium]|nr:hypothetical protein [Cytophagales bacterium]MDW8384087.1 hypothetical protein [Flammeovirgaceae bacterium]